MQMSEVTWSDDNWCVACGEDNPRGLHLQFRHEGDDYVCDFTPERFHQGWKGIVHGGILATLLDEAMNHMLSHNGEPVATAELTVRYRRPVKVGEPLQVRARLVRSRPPLYVAEAKIVDAAGQVVAEAGAKLMRVEAAVADRGEE